MSLADQEAGLADVNESDSVHEDPQGEIEEAIAKVWRCVFQCDRIGRSENFFGLGGDSLLAMKLVEALATTLEVEIPVVVLFQNPTVRELGQLMTAAS